MVGIRVVHYRHKRKRPKPKRKAIALEVSAVVTRATSVGRSVRGQG